MMLWSRFLNRRGMELIETTTGMRMTVSPKPVTVTVAAKTGCGVGAR